MLRDGQTFLRHTMSPATGQVQANSIFVWLDDTLGPGVTAPGVLYFLPAPGLAPPPKVISNGIQTVSSR